MKSHATGTSVSAIKYTYNVQQHFLYQILADESIPAKNIKRLLHVFKCFKCIKLKS